MKKILIIEDEKLLREMYKDKFSQVGFNVKTARDAEEGLKTTERERPDLILLDILLPNHNGIDFIRKLRGKPHLSKIKVIAFSNYDSKETREKAKKLGAEDYLIKTSYTPTGIVDKVKKYLR